MSRFRQSVERLADAVESNWTREIHRLPRVAASALQEHRPWEQFELEPLLVWVCEQSAGMADNNGSSFGEPAVILADRGAFYVELLFWDSQLTSIHEHAFAGAWAVVEGATLHVAYDFASRRQFKSDLAIGELRVRKLEVLDRSAITEIPLGSGLIHRALHLERPTVSLVVRTPHGGSVRAQRQFRAPSLAVGGHRSRATAPALEVVRLARLAERWRTHKDLCRTLVSKHDFYAAFLLVAQESPFSSPAVSKWLSELVHEVHGEDSAHCEPVLEYATREALVASRWSKFASREVRFFLGLLMTFADRESILRAVRSIFPESDPAELIENWTVAISGLDSCGVEFDDLNRSLFRTGLSCSSISEVLGHYFGPQAAFSVDVDRSELERHCRELYSSALFRPLFSELGD